MKSIFISCSLAFSIFIFSGCSNDTKKVRTTETPTTVTHTDSVTTATPDNSLSNNASITEMFTCTMHNEVLSTKPGTCPKCGMKLVKQALTVKQQKILKEGSFVKSKEEQ